MKNNLTRRSLLRNALYAGGATLGAPIIARMHLPALTQNGDLVEGAVRSFFAYGSSFEAEASNLLAPYGVQGPKRALHNILGLWGVRAHFRSEPDYSDARTCLRNFQMFANTTENEGFDSFSGVHRSPYDSDAGILIADNDRGRVRAGEQYGPTSDEIAIGGIDPDLLYAGADVLDDQRLAAGRGDLVRATVATQPKYRRNVETDQHGKVPCAVLDTAYGTHVVHVPPPYRPLGATDNYRYGYMGVVLPDGRPYWRGLA